MLCRMSEMRNLEPAETMLLATPSYLGCRNPVGLDHILVGPGVQSDGPAEHISIGKFGDNKPGDQQGVGQVLSISDHCPMIAKL